MTPTTGGSPSHLSVAGGAVTFRAFLSAVKKYPASASFGVGSSIAASALSVLGSLALGRIVDLIVDHGSPRQLLTQVSLILALGAGAAGFSGLARWLVSQLGAQVCADIREHAMESALNLDTRTVEAAGAGDVTARLSEDIDIVSRSIQLASSVFNAAIVVAISMFGFLFIDWHLTIVFAIILPVYIQSLRSFLPEARRRYRTERSLASTRTSIILETLLGTGTLIAYGASDRQLARVSVASQASVTAQVAVARWFGRFANSMNYAELLGLVSVLSAGFYQVRSGIVTIGQVTAATLLFHRLFGPLGAILLSFSDMQAAAVALARLIGLSSRAAAGTTAVYPKADGDDAVITLRGVSHRYQDGDDVLTGIDLDLPARTSLAIVGESGAGKSTLAAIMGGLITASSGEVRYGDQPMYHIPAARLRAIIGVVTQEVHMFAGPLWADLRLAAPEATFADMWRALELVEAADWVKALEDGLETVVGETGVQLSSSQCQQVALARLILLDPKVVILDEATADAGSSGANALERASANLVRNRAAVIVAHRLNQARQCDRIIVLSAGRIVESGTHASLIDDHGTYARLWKAWKAT